MKYVTRKRLKVVAIVALALVLAAGIVASGFAIAEVAIEGKYEFLSYDGSKGGDSSAAKAFVDTARPQRHAELIDLFHDLHFLLLFFGKKQFYLARTFS